MSPFKISRLKAANCKVCFSEGTDMEGEGRTIPFSPSVGSRAPCLPLMGRHRPAYRAVCDYAHLLILKACCGLDSMWFAGICRGSFFESGNYSIPAF